MKSINSAIVILLLLCASCNSGNATHNNATAVTDVKEQADDVKTFTTPEIPVMCTTPEQKGEFIILHYWDNFDFSDTTYVNLPDVTEQAFADYVYIANQLPLDLSREGVLEMINRAGDNRPMYDYFIELSEKYLRDPNSPFRNEELYMVVLESMIASPLLDEAEKIRPAYRLELAKKNRVGEKAINFTYTLKSGKTGTLYQHATNFTLLFFTNPGCPACAEVIQEITNSAIINNLLEQKLLTVLSIYPDEELEEWNKHLSDYPTVWINGYDKGAVLQSKSLYDLKAIPTLYLLDKEKKVLLKDITMAEVESYFMQR